MALTDSQIDRYSRQIILPEVGGRGQERLLGARLRLIAEPDWIDPALSYLVGAGVGRIAIESAGLLREQAIELRARLCELNPDVEIDIDRERSGAADLDLILISGAGSLRAASQMGGARTIVAARLAHEAAVAVIRSRPPCVRCIDEGFLKPIEGSGEDARIAAMVAVTESLNLLATDVEIERDSKMIRITGCSSDVEIVRRDKGCGVCGRDSGSKTDRRP